MQYGKCFYKVKLVLLIRNWNLVSLLACIMQLLLWMFLGVRTLKNYWFFKKVASIKKQYDLLLMKVWHTRGESEMIFRCQRPTCWALVHLWTNVKRACLQEWGWLKVIILINKGQWARGSVFQHPNQKKTRCKLIIQNVGHVYNCRIMRPKKIKTCFHCIACVGLTAQTPPQHGQSFSFIPPLII